MDDRTYRNALAHAEELGARAGDAAANSFFDGNTTRETYARYAKGIADGDPAVLDQLPLLDWSASEEQQVYEEIVDFVERDDSESPEENDLLEYYADAFTFAVQREVERLALAQLA